MARVKRGTISKKRHKKLLSKTKGYRGTKSRLVKVAREAILHAGQYAYHGRKLRKREMRRLWITRISEAVKQEGISYSRFVHGLAKANIGLDRKILAQILTEDQAAFKKIVQKVKSFI